MSDEPAVARSVAGPALLGGAVLLFVHAAASALLTVLAATASPGPGAPGGLWPAALWTGALGAAALALRPILRRVAQPVTTAVAAGVLVGVAYTVVSVGLAGPGETTPWLWARVASLVAAAAASGALTRKGVGAVAG